MVKMVELLVTDAEGRVLNRVAVNEELFNEVLRRVGEGKGSDMATAWFLAVLQAILGPTTAGGTTSASYTDTSGAARTQNFKNVLYGYYTTSPTAVNFFNTGTCNNRLWIGYGTSSTPPTRSDYKLGNKLGEGITSISVDESQGVLTISASFTFTTSTVVYEVGLEWEGTVASNATCGRVLLDRTVIPNGIPVAAGQTLTVVYRFIFP
jgi:hypothetical protein